MSYFLKGVPGTIVRKNLLLAVEQNKANSVRLEWQHLEVYHLYAFQYLS